MEVEGAQLVSVYGNFKKKWYGRMVGNKIVRLVLHF